MFSEEQRNQVRDCVLNMARSDPRVTAGALTGSAAASREDEWSDVDVAFGIAEGHSVAAVLDDWTRELERELGVLHYWDLPSGSSIYRVFLLPTGMEIDIGVTPGQDFGARGPAFRKLFGTTGEPLPSTPPDAQHIVGLGWHHIFHARSSIERGKLWRAEYWIGQVREKTLTLACLRFGKDAYHGRGIDSLPDAVKVPLEGTLVCALEVGELRRCLRVATLCFISELDALDPELFGRLEPLLQKFGAS
ncbi:MAG TPA: hypothetical protein VLQ48_16785 [Chloroflexia bacterium]|nr:hypothetical protein [Chloroflexia bacterium]